MDGESQNGLWALAAVGVVVAGLGIGVFQTLTTEHPPDELYVEAVSNSSVDETVAFEDLAREQRRVFERAVNDEDGSAMFPQGMDESVWRDVGVVTYRNRTYSVAIVDYN